MAYESLMVFTGNANPLLAHAVVRRLNIPLGHATVGKFSDGEIMVELLENVRGKDCFVLQSTCAPANDSLMEVLLMVDALKRASAARVTAAIPYFGYGRQDRRPRSARVAISAKVVANMLQAVGVDRMMTMDLHADQIQGFFDVPVDNIYATPVLLGDGHAGGDGHHPAVESGANLQENPRAVGRGTAGGDDIAHQQRGFGQFFVHGVTDTGTTVQAPCRSQNSMIRGRLREQASSPLA